MCKCYLIKTKDACKYDCIKEFEKSSPGITWCALNLVTKVRREIGRGKGRHEIHTQKRMWGWKQIGRCNHKSQKKKHPSGWKPEEAGTGFSLEPQVTVQTPCKMSEFRLLASPQWKNKFYYFNCQIFNYALQLQSYKKQWADFLFFLIKWFCVQWLQRNSEVMRL